MDGGEADAQHIQIMTMSSCEFRWMYLGIPWRTYLFERAPRRQCYASLRSRPADGANGAMHTVGEHMRLEIK